MREQYFAERVDLVAIERAGAHEHVEPVALPSFDRGRERTGIELDAIDELDGDATLLQRAHDLAQRVPFPACTAEDHG